MPRSFRGNGGFTLLELIVVIAIISIMAMLVVPRIPRITGTDRGSFVILTGIIARCFDDAYLKGNTNYLIVHLYERGTEFGEYDEKIFSRENGVSVVTMNSEGKFVDSSDRLLSYHRFPGSFRIEEVLLAGADPVRQGSVFIPFYPSGASDNAVIHILAGGDARWSVRINRLKKEARIIHEYVGFE
ncbi:MAG: type II secretion system protein [Spirochaetales bacterium]|nr:MAG: type II secretion system protein [Spirochaetales bacterium]